MKDYNKSFFWSALRLLGIYPYHVRSWRCAIVNRFHRMTFGKFINAEKQRKLLEKHVVESIAWHEEILGARSNHLN